MYQQNMLQENMRLFEVDFGKICCFKLSVFKITPQFVPNNYLDNFIIGSLTPGFPLKTRKIMQIQSLLFIPRQTDE